MKFRYSLLFAALLHNLINFAQCNLTPSPTLTSLGSTTICPSGSVGFSLTLPPVDVWRQKTYFPSGSRIHTSGFSIGNKGYAGFGYGSPVPPLDLWEYDPATDVWTQKASMPSAFLKYSPMTFVIGTNAYVGMGAGVTNKDFWEYNSLSNTWLRKADFPTDVHAENVCFTINGKCYAGTGVNTNNSQAGSDFYEYDPVTDVWTQKAPFGGGARAATYGFALNGNGYIGGGYSNVPGFVGQDLWEYNPVTDTWTQKGNTGFGPAAYGQSFAIGNKGYVRTSEYPSTSTFWQYEPTTDTWTQKTNAPTSARYYAGEFSVGGKLYFGGESADGLWEYSPELSYVWSTGATTPSISVSAAGTYSVMITDLSGCVTTLTQVVTVNAAPVVNISGTATMCAGGSVQLTAGGADTYTWSSNAGSANTAMVSLSPGTNTSYTVTGTSTQGCTNTAVQTVTVINQPLVTATAGTTAICQGGSTTLNGGGAVSYTWSGGITNGASVSPATTTAYTVTGTSAAGCTNTAVETITVNNLPAVTANITNSAICRGQATTLYGGGASTYVWTGAAPNGVPFSPTVSASYTVTGTDANSCTNTAVQFITVNIPPTVSANVTSSLVCNGTTVILSGSGANSYAWTNGVTDGVAFAPATTISYTVTGTDVNSCTNTAVQTVSVNNPPNLFTSASSAAICIGGSTTLNGLGAATYTWSGGAINGTAFSPTITQTYTVTGTAANGCTNTAVRTITVNNLPAVTASATNSVICMNNTVTLTGGGASTYTWTGGVTNGSAFSPTITATYTVTGTDANTCTNTAVKSITVNALPIVTASVTNSVICMGFSTTLSGGGALTYSWTGGVTDATPFSPTSTANYTVTGTDANTCTNTAVKSVTVNALPLVTASATNPVICIGYSTALSGGGASTYTWTNGVTDGTAFLPTITTTYTVTGTDVNTCTNTAVKTITVNNLPVVTASASSSVICMNNTVTLTGGGASTYTWTGGVTNGSVFSPTITATYTVTGTDVNTCTNTAVKSITVNALPIVTASVTNSVICIGFSTTLSGGGALTYSWTGGVTDAAPFSPTSTASYTVTGTDANTCTNTAVKSVTVNALPLVTASATNPVICIGYSTALSGGGASTYTWTNGVTDGTAFLPTITTTYTVTGTDVNTCTNTAVKTITVNNLPVVTASASSSVICMNNTVTLTGGGASTYTWTGGVTNGSVFSPTITATYTVTGTDANTCTNTAVKSITVNALPIVTASVTNSVICIGFSTTLSGGGASTYTWTGGVSDAVPFSPTITAAYTVTGTDANTCTNTAVKTVTVNNLPVVTASTSSNVICMNNTVTLTGGGATTYTWTNGVTNGVAFSPTITNTYTVTGTDLNTCTNTAVRSVTVNNLPVVTASASNSVICMNNTVTLTGGGASTYTWTGGVTNGAVFSPTITATYTVTGTDANTCTNTAVKSITVHALPVVTANVTNSVICIGRTTVLSGGGAVSYTWTAGVTNGAAFAPTSTTTYTVIGRDANTCTNTAVKTITVNSLPVVTASASSNVICINNTITLNGGGALTYTWTNGVTNGVAFAPIITRTYTVTGTDANTCTNTAVRSVTVNNLPVVTANTSSNVICMNNTVTLTGGGATTYTWTNGVTNAVAFSPTITATYTVTGTDLNTCTNTAVRTVTVNSLPVVTASSTHSVICMNQTVALSGGGALTYTWTSPVIDGTAFSPTITKTYTVIGRDANTCTNTAVTTVTVNSLPVVTASAASSVICIGESTALNAAGASTYTWTGGVTNGVTFFPTSTIDYTVTGTDLNGCNNTAVQSVTVKPLPVVTANTQHPVICMNATTSLSGGGAATYTWTGGVTDGIAFSPTSTVTYTVTGTGVNGCTNTAVRAITVHVLPVVTASATRPVICFNGTTSLNGAGASTYAWTNGVTNATAFSPTITTTYTVTGTDVNTCTNTAVQTVTVNNLPVVTSAATNSVICEGYSTTLNAAGAITYTWSGGITDGVAFSPTTTTAYTVTGTGANTCTNTSVTTVTVHALPHVVAYTTRSVVCNGHTTTVNGVGAITYTWTNGLGNGVPFTPTATATYSVTGTDFYGCVNSTFITVTVNPLPVITASVSSPVICAAEQVTFTSSGANTYTWSAGITGGVAFTPTGTSTYSVAGTSADGCISSNTVNVNVTVNPRPVITVNSGAVCIGKSFTLVPGGAVTYTYSSPGLVVTPSVTTGYSFSGTSADGCVSFSPAVSIVVIHPLPVISLSAGSSQICFGKSTTITASGANTYTWDTGVMASSVAVTPFATEAYTVTGTSIHQCVSSNTIEIVVVPVPTISVASDRSAVCDGSPVTLTANGAQTYSWSTRDRARIISAIPGDRITTYTVTGFNSNCSDTKTISVSLYSKPAVALEADVELKAGDTYRFKPAQAGGVSFKWESSEGLDNAFILDPVTSIGHTITYTLTVTNNEGCSASDDITVTVINDDLLIANYMSPNGDGKNDTWKISNLYLVKDYSVEIIDGWGKTVFAKDSAYENEFDAHDLPDGVYYYFMKEGSKVKYKGNITVTR